MSAIRWLCKHGLFGPLLMVVTIIGAAAAIAGHHWWLVLLIAFVIMPSLFIAAGITIGGFIWFADWVDRKVNPPGTTTD